MSTPFPTRPICPDRTPRCPTSAATITASPPALPASAGDRTTLPPAPGDVAPPERSATQRIADAIVKTYTTRYGKGPESIRVHLTGDTVTALLRGGFTVVEESLCTSGQAATVRDQRRAFGDMIAPALSAAVSAVVDRDVVAVLGDTHQHPDLTAIVLVLARRSA